MYSYFWKGRSIFSYKQSKRERQDITEYEYKHENNYYRKDHKSSKEKSDSNINPSSYNVGVLNYVNYTL